MERREPDTAIARAIDEVLAAEREAAVAVEAARLQAESLIEAARTERRRLLERARRRSSRLHAAAQARMERELAALEHESAAPDLDPGTLEELTQQAVERLARRLTAPGHERT